MGAGHVPRMQALVHGPPVQAQRMRAALQACRSPAGQSAMTGAECAQACNWGTGEQDAWRERAEGWPWKRPAESLNQQVCVAEPGDSMWPCCPYVHTQAIMFLHENQIIHGDLKVCWWAEGVGGGDDCWVMHQRHRERMARAGAQPCALHLGLG